MKKFVTILAAALALAAGLPQLSALEITLPHPVPANIFETGSDVRFDIKVTDKENVRGTLNVTVTDYWGETVLERKFDLPAGKSAEIPLELGRLDRGYYEVALIASNQAGDAKQLTSSFGVMDFVDRTAAEAREGGYRFGMKLWLISEIWWNRKLKWDPDMIMAVCCKLGLQWTRAQLGQVNHMDTRELIKNHPVNVILKVETYPKEMIDRDRYPEIEDFDQVKGGVKALLPKKDAYQAYLKQLVAEIPADQNVFEIWNEPWQWKTLPAEDFALLMDWAAEAIKEVRPNAIIGPNIYGKANAYDQRVINFRKFRNIDMVAIHPYCTRTTEYRGFRQIQRNYRDYVKQATGKEIDLYCTEFGWSTGPEGDRVVSEPQQARNTVREAFELYADDVKALIPHTMASREQNPKDREDWFGFFRLNSEPKPALIAFANAARMIDGSRFLGEHDFGHGIGAMRFEKEGREILALWTEDKDIPLTLETGAAQVVVGDFMGREQARATRNGKLELQLSGDPIYVIGMAPGVPVDLAGPGAPVKLDRWRERKVMAQIGLANALPGFGPRSGSPAFEVADKNSKSSMRVWMEAAPEELMVTFDVKDKAIVLNGPDGKGFGDRIELELCLRPDRQSDQLDIFDYQFKVTPAKGDRPAQLRVDNLIREPLMLSQGDNAPGLAWNYQVKEGGYTVQLKIATSFLGKPGLAAGDLISCRAILYNRDREDINEWEKFHTRSQTQNNRDNQNQLNLIEVVNR